MHSNVLLCILQEWQSDILVKCAISENVFQINLHLFFIAHMTNPAAVKLDLWD